jgi:hypothetical protein
LTVVYAAGHLELRSSEETKLLGLELQTAAVTVSVESKSPKESQKQSLNVLLGIEDLVRMIAEYF